MKLSEGAFQTIGLQVAKKKQCLFDVFEGSNKITRKLATVRKSRKEEVGGAL